MKRRMKRKLPLGIQTFRKIREQGCYYVDKTAYARRLAEEGDHYFLSRPRRFGKSLFLDTLKELFEGNEPLFRGLAVHAGWDWSVRRPVVRLDFSSGSYRGPDDLHREVMEQLDAIEETAGEKSDYGSAPARLRHLLRVLHRRSGRRVALLVDEYDKPILDAIGTPEVAEANRDYLRGLYSVTKASDADIDFSFLTGVSKFAKVSLFSGLNNPTDLTLDPACAAICGYTEADLDTVFADELPGLDRERIREWYNGYNWLGKERLYNPFDILQLFRSRRFRPYWFETGTPAFLIDTLMRRRVSVPSLDGLRGDDDLLSRFDVRDVTPEALLFQTGYLTIREEEAGVLGAPVVPAGLPEPRSALEPEPEPAGGADSAGQRAPDAGTAAGGATARRRLRWSEGAAPGVVRGHPVRVAHAERDRPLRGLLRERVLRLAGGGGAGRDGGGQRRGRACRPGRAARRERLPVRVQGGRPGAGRVGAGAVADEGLRRQVPAPGAGGPPDRGGVQPPGAERRGLRDRARLRIRRARRPE